MHRPTQDVEELFTPEVPEPLDIESTAHRLGQRRECLLHCGDLHSGVEFTDHPHGMGVGEQVVPEGRLHRCLLGGFDEVRVEHLPIRVFLESKELVEDIACFSSDVII